MYITHVSSNLHESIYYSIPKQFTKLLQSISRCYSKSNQTEKLIHHSGLELFLWRKVQTMFWCCNWLPLFYFYHSNDSSMYWKMWKTKKKHLSEHKSMPINENLFSNWFSMASCFIGSFEISKKKKKYCLHSAVVLYYTEQL